MIFSDLKKSWLAGFAAIAMFILVAAFATFKINDPDTMHYLANGKQIMQHGFNQACVFSFSSTTCSTVYNEWLFHVTSYGVYNLGGWIGLGLLQVGLGLILYALLFIYGLKRSKNFLFVTLILFSSVFVVMERFMLRADLLAMVCFVIVFICAQYLANSSKPNWPVIAVLALTQLIWTNSHGSFIFGWIIVGAFATAPTLKVLWQKLRTKQSTKLELKSFWLWLVVGLVLLVSMINPYGIKALLWPFQFFFGPAEFHSQLEFISPFASTDFVRLAVRVYYYLLPTAGLILLVQIKKVKLAHLLIIIPLLYLSLLHVRYIALFSVAIALILPEYLLAIEQWLAARLARRQWFKRTYTGVTALLALLIIYFSATTAHALFTNKFYIFDQRSREFGLGLSQISYPIGAVDFIKTNHIAGPGFNDYGSGTYINWALYPQQQSFIDGDTYTLESLHYYNAIVNGTIPYNDVAKKFKLNYFLIDYANPGTLPLVSKLYNDPSWVPVYFDENSVVFLSATVDNLPFIQQWGIDFATENNNVGDNAQGWTNRGIFLSAIQLQDKAWDSFQKAVEAQPDYYVAWNDLGAVEFQLGQENQALEAYQKSIALEDQYAPTNFNLALYYQKNNQWDNAIKYFNHTLSINSHYLQANYFLGQIYEAQNKKADAMAAYKKELTLNPNHTDSLNALARLQNSTTTNSDTKDNTSLTLEQLEEKVNEEPKNAELRVQLGVVYGQKQENDKAIEQFQQAIAIDGKSVLGHLNLANAYSVTHQDNLALQEYETVIALDPKQSDAYLNLGIIYFYQLHQNDKAIGYWNKFLELAPEDPQAGSIKQVLNTIQP